MYLDDVEDMTTGDALQNALLSLSNIRSIIRQLDADGIFEGFELIAELEESICRLVQPEDEYFSIDSIGQEIKAC